MSIEQINIDTLQNYITSLDLKRKAIYSCFCYNADYTEEYLKCSFNDLRQLLDPLDKAEHATVISTLGITQRHCGAQAIENLTDGEIEVAQEYARALKVVKELTAAYDAWRTSILDLEGYIQYLADDGKNEEE